MKSSECSQSKPSRYQYSGTMRTTSNSGVASKGPRESGGKQKRPREDEPEYNAPIHKKQKLAALPKGLVNFSNACFSNAALQVLDATMTTEQVAHLAGKHAPEAFGADFQALSQLKGNKLEKALRKVRETITESSQVKMAPYMGNVLESLRSDQRNAANPVMFQQVFAFGSDQENRERFCGDTQQDVGEYLVKLIPALSKEHSFVSGNLECRIQTSMVCTAKTCDYINAQAPEPHVVLPGQIPHQNTTGAPKGKKNKSSTTVEAVIGTVLDHELLEGSTCEKCGTKDALERRTRMVKYPDHLLVSIGRSQFVGRAASATKNTTKVNLNFGDIPVGEDGVVYRMIAMVQHKGLRATNGHYMTYRKVEDSKWAFINDDVVKPVLERNLDDGVLGYSSVLLLQRQQKPAPTMLLERELEG